MPPAGVELDYVTSEVARGYVETKNPGGTKNGTVSAQPDLQRLAEALLSLAEEDRRRLLRLLRTDAADQ